MTRLTDAPAPPPYFRVQLCNLSFLLAALVSDVLLIRLFLSLAYIFLLTAAALGLPKWPDAASTGYISVGGCAAKAAAASAACKAHQALLLLRTPLTHHTSRPAPPTFPDTLVWAGLALFFHLLSLCRLLWDERPVRFASEDEEQLWRFFYRRSGMGRLEMQQVLRYGGWRRVAAGEPILRGHEARLNFCLLVEGRASVRSMHQQHVETPRPQFSGCCFDKGRWVGRSVETRVC